MGSWIFRTGRPQTLERLATACLLTMYVLVNDNGNESEEVCTKPAVEYRKQSPAVCACMHACIDSSILIQQTWLFLFVSGKLKLRITAGHLLDGYENLMRLAQDNLGGRAGLQRGGSLFFFSAL